MKTFLSLLCFLGTTFGFSQTYYETSWISNDVKYTALVIFYQDNEALVRVKYYANGSDKLASFLCNYTIFTKTDGSTDKYLNGVDAILVKGPSGSSYSADNFYIKEQSNGNFNAYTVDDNGFEGGDITRYMKPMLYWVRLNPEAMTRGYLDDYFKQDEAIFQILDFVNNGESSFDTSFTAVTGLAYGLSNDEEYNDGLWSVIMSSLGSKAYTAQKIKESETYPSDWIRDQWNNGFYITELAFDTIKKTFLVVMSKRNGLGPQSWKKETSFPKDWITQKWDTGYHITSMTCGNGEWYVAMDKNTGFSGQRWKTSYEIPKDWIKENWDSGYSITTATYGNGLWALSMSSNANLGQQSWRTEYEYPIDWIREKSNEGYSISSIAHGNNMWFVVMSNGSSIKDNRSTTSYNELPIDWILDNAN